MRTYYYIFLLLIGCNVLHNVQIKKNKKIDNIDLDFLFNSSNYLDSLKEIKVSKKIGDGIIYIENDLKTGDSTTISGSRTSGFTRSVITRDSPIYTYAEFYPNGHLKAMGFMHNGNTNTEFKDVSSFVVIPFSYGLWKLYDPSGKVEQEIDYELYFKYTFDQMLSQSLTVLKDFPSWNMELKRSVSIQNGKGKWVLSRYLGSKGIIVVFDGMTGKEVSRVDAVRGH